MSNAFSLDLKSLHYTFNDITWWGLNTQSAVGVSWFVALEGIIYIIFLPQLYFCIILSSQFTTLDNTWLWLTSLIMLLYPNASIAHFVNRIVPSVWTEIYSNSSFLCIVWWQSIYNSMVRTHWGEIHCFKKAIIILERAYKYRQKDIFGH